MDAIATNGCWEGYVAALHEQVVILDAGGPTWREADFDTGAERATPTHVVVSGNLGPIYHRVDVIGIACHRSAALGVEQHGIERVADVAGQQAQRICLGANDACREGGADIGAAEVGPVALTFDAVDRIEYLPTIADLAADGASSRIMAALGGDAIEIPAIVARSPATIETDVVTGPVVDCGYDRRRGRLDVDGLRGEVRAKRGSSRTECADACSQNQQILHSSVVPFDAPRHRGS